MTSLTVDLKTPQGIVLEKCDIPTDYTTYQIIQELIDHLQLPHFTGERGVNYSLKWSNRDLILDLQRTLTDIGVASGDQLELLSSSLVDEIKIVQDSSDVNDGISNEPLKVIVSVLDLNRTDEEIFHPDCTINDLTSIICMQHKLPKTDAIGATIGYYIRSQSLGRVLKGSETLKSAGVPRQDRLALLRQEIAGGAPVIDVPRVAANQVARQLPLELLDFIQQLDSWAGVNEKEAKADAIKFWSLKVPAMLAASCSGVIASLHLPSLVPVMIGIISGICVALDGMVRPGKLFSVHKRAVHDIRWLQTSIVNEWSIAKLQHRESDEIAAIILTNGEKKRLSISNYLRSGEMGIYLHAEQILMDESAPRDFRRRRSS